MTIIPDSNIIISALINENGTEFNLATNAPSAIQFATPSFLIDEVRSKIAKISKLTQNSEFDILANLETLLAPFIILFEKDLANESIDRAIKLVSTIDLKDALFVAVTIHCNGILWTGDLKLLRGLRRKGFTQIITTKELVQIISGL